MSIYEETFYLEKPTKYIKEVKCITFYIKIEHYVDETDDLHLGNFLFTSLLLFDL